jgi:hypothetical protein
MRRIIAIALLVSSIAPAQAIAPIPGYNVGINPVMLSTGVVAGQLVILCVVPGSQVIATFHDPAYLPAGTTRVRLTPVQWGVYEPQACAVGARLFFDTTHPISAYPNATVGLAGINIFGPSWPLEYLTNEPFYTTWYVNYCNVAACTSPCGTSHRDPVFEAYAFVPAFY